MRLLLLSYFFAFFAASVTGQFMYERPPSYKNYPINIIQHIDTSLHEGINTPAAFLVYFKIDPTTEKVTYSHSLAYSSSTKTDLAPAIDKIMQTFGQEIKQTASTKGATWYVLPVAIYHPSHKTWYKGLSSDFRDVPEAFVALRDHLLATPGNVLPTLFASRPYWWRSDYRSSGC